MKAQIGRGKSLKGLLAYTFEGHKDRAKEKGARLIGGTCSCSTLAEIQSEFAALRKIRPDIKRPAWHCSLSLKPPERLSDEQWAQVAEKYMKGMGFTDKHLYCVVRHSDTPNDHVHIVASRIAIDGSVYLGQQEAKRSMPLTNQLACEFGLSELGYDTRAEVKGITPGEKGMVERTGGAVPARLQLQAIVDTATADKPSFAEFVARLHEAGVSALPSGKSGSPQGVSFEYDGIAFKGSDLGKSYAWKQLQARIDYDKDRDQQTIDDLRAAAQNQEKNSLQQTPGESHGTRAKPIYFEHRIQEPHLDPRRPRTLISLPKLSERCLVSYDTASRKTTGLLPDHALGSGHRSGGVRRTRTLELAFEHDDTTNIYRWRSGSGGPAFTDQGNKIDVHSQADAAVKASLQLSKDKGWESTVVSGAESFRRKSWLIGTLMGLEIQGYEPTEADKEELNRQLELKEAARNERKNSGAESQGRSPGARENGHGRASELGPADGLRPELDSGRSPGSDGRSQGSESPVRQQPCNIVEVQAAGTSHTRSSDLARDGGITVNRRDIRRVADVAGALSDLAAPVKATERDKPATRLEQPPTREHAAKIAAWKRQSEALGAEKYRITLKPRAEKDRNGRKLFDQNYGNAGKKSDREAAGIPEKFWTKDEIKAEIAKLRAKNAMGYDVYVTPIDPYCHFIVVDDMTPEKEKALLDVGIKPAIIQKSSENNKQAIIIIDKESGAEEQKLANQIVTRLNKKWGDPKFTGVVHPFRLAGFSNKKDGKNNYITTLELSIHRKCNKVSAGMQKLRDDERLKKQEADELKIKEETDKERSRRLSRIDTDITGNAVEQAYRREVNKTVGLAKKKGWTLDWSRVDYGTTKTLLKAGYRADLIEKAIIEVSPELADRHKDAAKYAADTVNNASADKDVLTHIAERAKRAEQETVLGLGR